MAFKCCVFAVQMFKYPKKKKLKPKRESRIDNNDDTKNKDKNKSDGSNTNSIMACNRSQTKTKHSTAQKKCDIDQNEIKTIDKSNLNSRLHDELYAAAATPCWFDKK